MSDILVTEEITGEPVEQLKRAFSVRCEPGLWQSPDRLLEMVPRYRALIVRNQTRVTAEVLSAARELQVVGRAGAGLDNIDVAAATAAGITVVYAPEQNSISVAELTLGLMLALARKIAAADRSTREGRWERHAFTGVELHGKTLGIVGLGRIGFRTAMRAQAFGMRIIACDKYANPDGALVSEARVELVSLDELLARSDFVSCHLPLADETRGLFDYARFCRMRPTAFFVNTSRGEVVDEEGLIRALEGGRIAGAALDVREREPPAKGPLSAMDNALLMPHIGAFTREGQGRVVSCVCDDVAAVLRGERPRNAAN